MIPAHKTFNELNIVKSLNYRDSLCQLSFYGESLFMGMVVEHINYTHAVNGIN